MGENDPAGTRYHKPASYATAHEVELSSYVRAIADCRHAEVATTNAIQSRRTRPGNRRSPALSTNQGGVFVCCE
jgi:hypothetical protein